jgi:hypothetical protein
VGQKRNSPRRSRSQPRPPDEARNAGRPTTRTQSGLGRIKKGALWLGAAALAATISYGVPRLLEKGGKALNTNAPLLVSVQLPGEYQTDSFFTPMYLFEDLTPTSIPANVVKAGGADYYEWARQHGGVPGQEQPMRLILRGRSADPVIVNGIRARVLDRADPLQGWFTHDRGCGGVDIRNAVIDLDQDPPKIAFTGLVQENPGKETLALTLQVTSTDVEVIDVLAKTRRNDVKWELEILYSAAGESGVFTVRDGNEPFEVTALKGGRARFYRVDYPSPRLVRESQGDPKSDGMHFC